MNHPPSTPEINRYSDMSTMCRNSQDKSSMNERNPFLSPIKSFKTPTQTSASKLRSKNAILNSYNHHSIACSDRFIPNRAASSIHLAECELDDASTKVDEDAQVYKKTLASALLGTSDSEKHKILRFREKKTLQPPESFQNTLHARFSHNKIGSSIPVSAKKLNRYVPSAPFKVLDAPELVNDYYLNLLSWGSNNILAVALGQCVYLWNAETGDIEELMALENDDYVCSVSWTETSSASYLAIGTSDAKVQLWDVVANKQIRTMGGHCSRVGALAWNDYIISSGSLDGNIINHDVRARNHQIATLSSHEHEVCGLTWSYDKTTLASGGNDNALCLWRSAMMGNGGAGGSHRPAHRLQYHNAAVKAIAWCPWERNLLATGGGTADRSIKFWNTSNGVLLNSVDTGSQVCSLLWSRSDKELLSSHGYSQNEICLWKYPSMTKVKELTGHTSRVLHLAASPDGKTVVSGAADETLRFWSIFSPSDKSAKSVRSSGNALNSFTSALSLR